MSENASRLADRFLRIGITACFVIPALVWSDLVSERFLLPKFVTGEILFLGTIICCVAVGIGRRPHWASDSLVTAIMVAGVINALLSLAQAAGLPVWHSAREGRHVVYGTFGNPNLLAEYLAPLAVVGLAGVLGARSRPGRWAAGGAVALFLLAILLTETRSAWIGLGAGLLVLGLLAGDARIRRVVAGGLMGTVFLVAVWAPLRSRVALGITGNDPGVATRAFMWKVAIAMFKDHPVLGMGWGQYGRRYPDYAMKLQEAGNGRPMYAGITNLAHSDPLQLLAEGGLACTGIIVFMFGAFAWIGLSGIRRTTGEDRLRRSAGLAVAATVVGESLVAFPFHCFPTACLVLWGFAAAVPERGGGDLRFPPAARLILLVVLLFPAVLLRPFMVGAYVVAGELRPDGAAILEHGLMLAPRDGELRFRLGIARMREGRMDEAAKEFERALLVFPDPDVRFNLGYLALQRKDHAKAEEWFREGLRRYPYFKAPAWADYALALNGLGRRAEARTAAERALAIDPGLGRARVFLTELDKKGMRR
ncbi:MAG: O-antigen ligase family protein [Candidatus Coatesbacteria bacterium]